MKYYGRRRWLKELRESRGLNQFDAALHLGISLSYYQMIEYGSKNPSEALAIRMADYLRFSVEQLTSPNESGQRIQTSTGSLYAENREV